MNFDWSTELHLNITVLTLIAGTIVPFLVGLLTKTGASSQFKAVANAVLSAIAGGLAVAIEANGTVVLATLITAVITTFVTSNASYHGLWKPTGAAAAVADITGNSGLGAIELVDTPPLEFTRPISVAEQPVARTATKKVPAKKVAKRVTKKRT